MDRDLELRHLAQADGHLREGQQRLDAQASLIATLAERGLDTTLAENYYALLSSTLQEWHRHRDMIVAKLDE